MQKQAIHKRQLGVVVPVGALRGKSSLGVGEFPDLAEFAHLCKKMKVGLIQLLPVNDTGFESSPYSSLTAFGLHPLYLKIEELDEYSEAPPQVKKLVDEARRKFDNDPRFLHQQILKAKMEILHSLYDVCKTAIHKKADNGSLSAWIDKNSWVREYAVYRRLKEVNDGKSWKEWPEYRTVRPQDIEALWNDKKLREEHLFWVWLQEALDRQFAMAAAAVAEAGIILKGDLPILMGEDSCDVWANPSIFIHELSAGAPPDMYSPEGQNWGFPIYDWQAQEKDDYAWWRRRLAIAGRYYQAYRIDHVLGFFRIWASSFSDYSSALGRYVPYAPVSARDLKNLGFDKGRIRWVSQPHISTGELWDALRGNWEGKADEAEIAEAAKKIFSKALDRINQEDMWLFKKKIKGEKDIDSLGLHPAARSFLFKAWHDRIFYEYEKKKYFPVWYYRNSRPYNSLTGEEKKNLEILLEKHRVKSEKIWETQGKKLLSVLVEASSMLPCAEDLGAVPSCVPKVLAKLKILGLRVVRWSCRWEEDGHPFIPVEDYPQLSVCTAAVHDSSTVREWWEKEVDQRQFSGFIGVPSLPNKYNPGVARTILSKIAASRSRFRVFQIQDILHLSNKWYSENPASERINVPGTYNEFNWTYRLPAAIKEIEKDKELIRAAAELSRIKPLKQRVTEKP
ncbi:MAG: 4-alpha-glucanotransferase [Treponema sp.]|nr:4-alpha-glucanotransferase [Treponema sp.]